MPGFDLRHVGDGSSDYVGSDRDRDVGRVAMPMKVAGSCGVGDDRHCGVWVDSVHTFGYCHRYLVERIRFAGCTRRAERGMTIERALVVVILVLLVVWLATNVL